MRNQLLFYLRARGLIINITVMKNITIQAHNIMLKLDEVGEKSQTSGKAGGLVWEPLKAVENH